MVCGDMIQGITNVAGVLFISGMLPSFLAQLSAELMKMERHVYTREFQDSYYRPISFITAKVPQNRNLGFRV